jgi:hypothetical protein
MIMKLDDMDRKEIYYVIVIVEFGFDKIDVTTFWLSKIYGLAWGKVVYGKIARHSSAGRHLVFNNLYHIV